MMKRTKLFSRIAAMSLVAIMVCCMAASAYSGSSLSKTISGRDGRTYTGYTEIQADSSQTRFTGTAYVRTSNNSTVPAISIGCCAGLASGDSGEIFCTSQWSWNDSDARSHSISTPTTYSRYCAYALGWANVDATGAVELEKSPSIGQSIYRSVNGENELSVLAKATLTEDNSYPVNNNGETYGSALLADMVGKAPDLLAAVNQGGVSGYIRSADFPQAGQNAACAVCEIPLYNENGAVIGSFTMGV